MNLHLLKGQACGRGCVAIKPEVATESKVMTLDLPRHTWVGALAWLMCDSTRKGM